MMGDVNTAVQDPNAEKEESKLSKFLNWMDLAAKTGLSVYGAMNSGSAPQSTPSTPNSNSKYFLEWNKQG